MIDDQGYLTDLSVLVIYAVVFIMFGAYTRNVKLTILALGRAIGVSDPDNPNGLQDAITPRWQNRNNVINFIILALYGIQCFVTLTWYYAILVLLGTFFLAIPVAAKLFVPKPMSKELIKKIKIDLLNRKDEFQNKNDIVRAEKVDYILGRIDDL